MNLNEKFDNRVQQRYIDKNETMATTCTICVSNFNKTIRKNVKCTNCQTDICAACIKRYLADTIQEPNCMNCRQLYSKEFLSANFTTKYTREVLNRVRFNVVIEREKRYLPALVPRADAYRKMKSLDDDMKPLEEQYLQLVQTLKALRKRIADANETHTEDMLDEERTLAAEVKSLKTTLIKLNQEYTSFQDIYHQNSEVSIREGHPCINGECRGFLDDQYICGLCYIKVCQHCHLQIHDSHICNPEDIESIKAIALETHPCPTCATPIFKDYGCDQMFCVQCHTAFSWNTGRVVTGRIHNPHYFEWIRAKNTIMPREVGDIPCGGLPIYHDLRKKLRDSANLPVPEIVFIGAIYKFTHTLQTKEVRKYPVSQGRDNNLNYTSIKYLAGELSEEKWKSILFHIEKKKQLNMEKRLMLDMILAVLIDFFGVLMTADNVERVRDVQQECEELRKYFNECSDNLAKRFDVKWKKIDFDWSGLV